jgi:hypothetical protein
MDKADNWTESNGNPVVKRIPNSTLCVGKNIIAVHIQQNAGGAYFDCGVYSIFNPDKQDAISEVKRDKTALLYDKKAVAYDLSGREIYFPKKGLFVIDRKKVLFP